MESTGLSICRYWERAGRFAGFAGWPPKEAGFFVAWFGAMGPYVKSAYQRGYRAGVASRGDGTVVSKGKGGA